MADKSSIFNFGAGPACLPKQVLDKIKSDIPNWKDGISVMEIGHRSEPFMEILASAEDKLRSLLNIPENFHVLFMHGGARAQFSAIAMNLFHQSNVGDYIVTGHWSKEALQECARYMPVNIIADGETVRFKNIPKIDPQSISDAAKYVYYADNETIQGIEFHDAPTIDRLLIADVTSSILSKPIEWPKHALVFASAQKNLGIAGVTVVIVRKDLLDHIHPLTPSVLNYDVIAKSQSLYNTLPVFATYVMELVLNWVEQQGGIDYFENKAKTLSKQLYECIDNSKLFVNDIDASVRSRLNIPFSLSNAALDQVFLEQASQRHLLALKGHRAAGGCRASIYNAMPNEGVEHLIAFMKHFENENS